MVVGKLKQLDLTKYFVISLKNCFEAPTARRVKAERQGGETECNDKRNFVEEMAHKAEQAAFREEVGLVYKITKKLCGQQNSGSLPVKNKQGQLLTTEKEQAARWVQHFEEVLNRPIPESPADPAVSEKMEIDTTPQFTTPAIQAMKSGKAPGIDSLQASYLKLTLIQLQEFSRIFLREYGTRRQFQMTGAKAL